MREVDAVVVGAGFGGIGAALRLAEGGARVLLAERTTYPGGCACTFEFEGDRFEGAFENGGLSGTAAIAYRRGDRYHGEVVCFRRHGRGECIYSGGSSSYAGEWENDRRHGRGKLSSSHTDSYEGEWRDDLPSGNGVLQRANGEVEEGRFEEARRLLYWVLANQQRAPLTPSMRAEIDYLIPLTYYQQGRATGLEQEGA